ncbi:MAG: PilZ protein [Brevundimonas sp.]|nr:PilZ protein [Brevundimonas sp.]
MGGTVPSVRRYGSSMAFLSTSPDRRIAPRRPTNTRGVLVAPGLELSCLILDLSAGGLRVRMDRAMSLPRTVMLVDVVAGTVCEADVAWSKGLEAGLKCGSKTNALSGLVPARFMPARDAWLRAGGR